jgi:hypothetical protein
MNTKTPCFVKRTSDASFSRLFSGIEAARRFAQTQPADAYLLPLAAQRGSAGGHAADGSSIQRHSCGELYPMVIVQCSNASGLLHGVLEPGQREPSVWFVDYSNARLAALDALEVRRRENAQLGRPYATLDEAHDACNDWR